MRSIVQSIVRWDVVGSTAIFGLRGRRLVDGIVGAVSWTGNGYVYPLLAGALLAVNPQIGRAFAVAAIVAFAVELPVYKTVKHFVRRYRPYEALPSINARVKPSDRFSFPSGHTAAAFLVATLLSYSYPFVAPLAGAWALGVGFSRIYLGVHYPTDVVAGMVLGTLSAWCGIAVAG